MKLPKTVSIGGIKYSVKEIKELRDSDNSKLDGVINYNKLTISIEADMSEDMKYIILWHEVIHGILNQSDIPHKENLVATLGYGIYGFLRANKMWWN